MCRSNERGEIKMDFGYSGNYHFDEWDKKEILANIENGMTVEEAVEDWQSGLNDIDYAVVEDYLFNRIVEYIESEVEK
jgi:hypothetical protein